MPSIISHSDNMAAVQAVNPHTAAAINGTRTVVIHPQPVLRLSAPSGIIRLRAEPSEQRHIQWAEDVVDNEGMGKKSSKVCCIYHKPRVANESSDDDDDDSSDHSSSDSDSASEPDNSVARPSGRTRARRGRHPRAHDHHHDHEQTESSHEPPKRIRPSRKPSPNAYEKMPKNKK